MEYKNLETVFKVTRPVILWVKAPNQEEADNVGWSVMEGVLQDALATGKLKGSYYLRYDNRKVPSNTEQSLNNSPLKPIMGD